MRDLKGITTLEDNKLAQNYIKIMEIFQKDRHEAFETCVAGVRASSLDTVCRMKKFIDLGRCLSDVEIVLSCTATAGILKSKISPINNPATLQGTFLHNFLERLGLEKVFGSNVPQSTEDNEIQMVSDKIAKKGTFAQIERDFLTYLESLDGDLYFELPMIVKKDEIFISGTSDLVVVNKEFKTITLIDFKTSKKSFGEAGMSKYSFSSQFVTYLYLLKELSEKYFGFEVETLKFQIYGLAVTEAGSIDIRETKPLVLSKNDILFERASFLIMEYLEFVKRCREEVNLVRKTVRDFHHELLNPALPVEEDLFDMSIPEKSGSLTDRIVKELPHLYKDYSVMLCTMCFFKQSCEGLNLLTMPRVSTIQSRAKKKSVEYGID